MVATIIKIAIAWFLFASVCSSVVQERLLNDEEYHAHSQPPSAYHTEEERQGTTSSQDRVESNRIPRYVIEHAPLIHLYSKEEFWPCDIAEHLRHTRPYINYTPITDPRHRANLTNLDEWNTFGPSTFLQSDDDVEERPPWLSGKSNIPTMPNANDTFGRIEDNSRSFMQVDQLIHKTYREGDSLEKRRDGGRSKAPAVLIVVDKGNGVLDAFWFFFYSYNLGNKVFNVRFGNHVGDWEHTLIRFENGKPRTVFFSEHFFGEAYSWDAVEKIGKRATSMQPVGYSAEGTHAMYSMPGVHRYILPWGLLQDVTDQGPLWDPLLNAHTYTYNTTTDILRSSDSTPNAPVEWFYFIGHWGDKAYPLNDPRQYRFAGQYHYVNGPLGPRFKNLGRNKVCPGRGSCVIKHWRSAFSWPRKWHDNGQDDWLSEEDAVKLGCER